MWRFERDQRLEDSAAVVRLGRPFGAETPRRTAVGRQPGGDERDRGRAGPGSTRPGPRPPDTRAPTGAGVRDTGMPRVPDDRDRPSRAGSRNELAGLAFVVLVQPHQRRARMPRRTAAPRVARVLASEDVGLAKTSNHPGRQSSRLPIGVGHTIQPSPLQASTQRAQRARHRRGHWANYKGALARISLRRPPMANETDPKPQYTRYRVGPQAAAPEPCRWGGRVGRAGARWVMAACWDEGRGASAPGRGGSPPSRGGPPPPNRPRRPGAAPGARPSLVAADHAQARRARAARGDRRLGGAVARAVPRQLPLPARLAAGQRRRLSSNRLVPC